VRKNKKPAKKAHLCNKIPKILHNKAALALSVAKYEKQTQKTCKNCLKSIDFRTSL